MHTISASVGMTSYLVDIPSFQIAQFRHCTIAAPSRLRLRPLAFFAGIWTTWHGKRGTTEVGAIHPKAMPVILTSEEAVEQWLTLPVKEALALQKPLPDGAVRIVATGEKEDGLAA
jgi:hypothetical protein